eukprot:CAMPEP_0176018672 /NCGR_PEP_ID=MMETSP0120_2-20121206/8998_1 /TAXON_ID=160619 /ORGANISM="Kryptoperidinium foliaceum, Strain CCMP 1326" /LENGTH=293 /DNA_ID=CAMNT_0017351729 /DNA_START=68 /DNA_END=949 /DNA_ORIENTATION=-
MASVVDTLMFVDVDGVLNVGIRDDDDSPVLLNQACIDAVTGCDDPELLDQCGSSIARLMAAASRLPDSISPGDTEICPVLLSRLARIIRAAGDGDRCSVVLSSSWRHPKHTRRVRCLERQLSKCLGEHFEFDSCTELTFEVTAGERLQCIGDFVREYCAKQSVEALRVLVLDDFFIASLDGLSPQANEAATESAAGVEAHVRRCAPEGVEIRAKLIHCYEEWVTSEGVAVQAGAGLSEEHVWAAKHFLTEEVVSPLVNKPRMLDASSLRRAFASLSICWAGLASATPLVAMHY